MKKLIFLCLMMVLWAIPGYTQTEGTLNLPGGVKPPAKPAKPEKKPVYKPTTGAEESRATKRTSSLTVVAEPQAQIFLEPVGKDKKKQPQQGTIKDGRSTIIFNDLVPGEYQVSVALDGYEIAGGKGSTQRITLVANKPDTLEFQLRRITYNAIIKTNISTGEVTCQTASGKLIENIQNGQATVKGLVPGKYNIEITTDEAGYQPVKKEIEVGPNKGPYEFTLERLASDGLLSANWTSKAGWEAPARWDVVNKRLIVKTPGLALPIEPEWRHYADFELVSDITMMNGIAASFVVRARDSNNYYLIQVTGEMADEPYVLRGYVIKNGLEKRLSPPSLNASGATELLAKNLSIEVMIRCEGNKFTVTITDSRTGAPINLGQLTDPDRTFMRGAPGIAVKGDEQNAVARFNVAPLSKQP